MKRWTIPNADEHIQQLRKNAVENRVLVSHTDSTPNENRRISLKNMSSRLGM